MALYDDRKKKPQDDADAGAAIRTGLVDAGKVVQGTTAAALDNITRPVRNVQTGLMNVGRGFVGLPAVQQRDTPFQDAAEAMRPSLNAPIPLPAKASFANVQGTPSAPAAPVRNPAGPGPAAGAPAPAGGVATTVPPQRAAAAVPASTGFDLKPGDANSFTFSNGKTVPVPGLNAQAGTTTNAAPLALPAAYAAAPAATPDMSVNVPRPVTADPYNTRQANDDLKKIADTIDTELFRNSFAADRGSRSAREAQASMLGTLAALGGKQLDVAANVAGGDRDTAARYDLSGLDQTGQNQRAVLSDQGQTTRQGMDDTTKERVATLGALADLNKPQQITDANGNVLSVVGSAATPVTGPDGKPVRAAPTKVDGAITPAVALDALTKQLQTEAQSLQPNQQRMDYLQSQINTLMNGGGGGQTATNPKTGERQRYNPQTQQWEPIK